MKQQDVIALAREAGMEVHERKGEVRIGSAVITGCDSTDQVQRFAALVEARTREECAKVCLELLDLRHGHLAVAYAAKCTEAIRSMGEQT